MAANVVPARGARQAAIAGAELARAGAGGCTLKAEFEARHARGGAGMDVQRAIQAQRAAWRAGWLALAALGIVALAAGCGRLGAKSGAVAPAAQLVSVRVTEKGFVPAEVAVAAGRPIRLTFTRETDETCATRVVFASLKLKKDLPLNQPVTIDLPAQPVGRLAYACGMDMERGALLVR
jgi:hypothetical protein